MGEAKRKRKKHAYECLNVSCLSKLYGKELGTRGYEWREKKPGPKVCPACGSVYVEWLSYENVNYEGYPFGVSDPEDVFLRFEDHLVKKSDVTVRRVDVQHKINASD